MCARTPEHPSGLSESVVRAWVQDDVVTMKSYFPMIVRYIHDFGIFSGPVALCHELEHVILETLWKYGN